MQTTGNHQIARIVRHNDESLEVSEELGITQSVISRLWQRFQDDGNVSRCYRTGHPRVTTPNEDWYLAATAKRNRRSTTSDLSRQLSSATGTTVSRQTMYRRLGPIGLYARRPVGCVPLTATHCRLRLRTVGKCEKTGLILLLSESNCGEAVKFHLKCPSCKYNYTFFNSKKCDSSENYELNIRLVQQEKPVNTEAVREAVDEIDGKRDLAIAVDGSWQKCGFSSKNGLVTVTSVDTGKVIDVEVFSKHCYLSEQNQASSKLLTEAEIDRLQAYYGLAIRRNLSSVKDMQQAILAIILHKLSTDEKPQHEFCPSDTDTWCKFKKAELLGETYHHKNTLPVDVAEAMRSVFRDLANPELLKKCLHGGTQNPNESVNNVIWSRVPKKTFVQLEVLSLGTYDAVSSFNMGNVSKLEILRKLCIEPW
ncbi:uncharacterized protein TNCV_2166711 [Trichonephila clavipes]|nr:uncharacterized protein TNCV_2166711 [Trichonephila clavipes]